IQIAGAELFQTVGEQADLCLQIQVAAHVQCQRVLGRDVRELTDHAFSGGLAYVHGAVLAHPAELCRSGGLGGVHRCCGSVGGWGQRGRGGRGRRGRRSGMGEFWGDLRGRRNTGGRGHTGGSRTRRVIGGTGCTGGLGGLGGGCLLLGCLVRLGGRGLVRVVLLLGHLMSTLSMITFSAGRPSLLPSTVPVWPISFRICKPEVMCPKTVYPPAESLGRVVSEKTRKNCEPMLSASLACRAMAIVPAGYLSSGGAFSIGPKVYPGPPVPVAVGSPHCSRESGSSR